MLAELILTLDQNASTLGYRQSSLFHGILMENIDPEYAAFLHEQRIHPYSQYLERDDNSVRWHIKTLNKESYKRILLPLLEDDFKDIVIKKKDDLECSITEKTLKTVPIKKLTEEFYYGNENRYLELQFLTPTSFKSREEYQIFPDVRLLFQSLMSKYSASSDTISMMDEETLLTLADCSRISRYQLRSVGFPLEGIKIPAFSGRMTIRTDGQGTLVRYVNMLAKFGEYSGVGIKTSMGMGAMRVINRKERTPDERH